MVESGLGSEGEKQKEVPQKRIFIEEALGKGRKLKGYRTLNLRRCAASLDLYRGNFEGEDIQREGRKRFVKNDGAHPRWHKLRRLR